MANPGAKVVISAVDRATAVLKRIKREIALVAKPVTALYRGFKAIDTVAFSKVRSGLSLVAGAGRNVFRSLGQIVPIIGTLTGAASLAGIYKLATAWANAGTQMRVTSRAMGMDPRRLQVMGNAAKLAGGSADSMTEALGDLSQQQWSAAHGLDPAALARFQQLHLTIEDLTKLKPDQVFQRIAGQLRAIKNPAAQTAAAFEVFGSAAAGILPILQMSQGEYDRTLKSAQRYATWTQDQVDAANRLREKQAELNLAVQGFGYTLAKDLEPVLTPIIQAMADWLKVNGDFIAQQIDEYVKRFIGWLKNGGWDEIQADIKKVYDQVKTIVDALGGWKSAGKDALIAIGLLYAAPVLTGIAALTTGLLGVAGALAKIALSGGLGALRVAKSGVGALAGRAAVGAAEGGAWGGLEAVVAALLTDLALPVAVAGGTAYTAWKGGSPSLSKDDTLLSEALPADVSDEGKAAAKRYGLDQAKFLGLLRAEHGGYNTVSKAGAFGPAQLMPDTAKGLGVANSPDAPGYSWQKNLDAGARYFSSLLGKFHGNYEVAEAAYNAGPNSDAVSKFALTHDYSVLPSETQHYLARISTASAIRSSVPSPAAPVAEAAAPAAPAQAVPAVAVPDPPSSVPPDALAQIVDKLKADLRVTIDNRAQGTSVRVGSSSGPVTVTHSGAGQTAMSPASSASGM